MKKPKIQILVFSETSVRQDVYVQRKPIQDREVQKIKTALSGQFIIEECRFEEIRNKRDGVQAANDVNKSDCAAVILYIPIFINPAMVAHTAVQIKKPIAIMGNHAIDSFSQLGFLSAVGAIDQIGIKYKKISYDGSSFEAIKELLDWVIAVDCIQKLNGKVYGSIGGRSLGISTGVADLAQWEREFGVDIEHIDQLDLVKRAEQISPQRIKNYIDKIKNKYGAIKFDDTKRFAELNLYKMVASYLATEEIIQAYELDFAGIKCQTELSNGYCLQCLNIQILNDPYDVEGNKEPFVCSCEADADGALSMQILKTISGGQPTALQDIFNITEDEIVLANCGAMASYFAGLSDNPEENLSQVYLVPHGFGTAGGAGTQFVVAPSEFTFMRLTRKAGKYQMVAFKGQTVHKEREVLQDYPNYRPTSFVKHNIDVARFMKEFNCNHVHCVKGDYLSVLEEFCGLKGISCTIL
jgi:L-fucose isomerase